MIRDLYILIDKLYSVIYWMVSIQYVYKIVQKINPNPNLFAVFWWQYEESYRKLMKTATLHLKHDCQ